MNCVDELQVTRWSKNNSLAICCSLTLVELLFNHCCAQCNTLQPEMHRITTHVFNAVKDKLACRIGFFEVYGMDFMVDDDMKVCCASSVGSDFN